MKVPALQTLLLLSTSLDTNSDCTKIVCNQWLELIFEAGTDAEKLLSNVVQLRSAWDILLCNKLEWFEQEGDTEERKRRVKKVRKLEEIVSKKLAEFIDANIPYTMKRLSTMEIKHMYVGSTVNTVLSEIDKQNENNAELTSEQSVDREICSGPVNSGILVNSSADDQRSTHEADPTKGGTRVTAYLTFGCLRDEVSVSVASGQAEYLVEHYHCDKCEAHIIGTVLERIRHDQECAEKQIAKDVSVVEDVQEERPSGVKTFKSNWYCKYCEKQFDFTAPERLKHQKSHI